MDMERDNWYLSLIQKTTESLVGKGLVAKSRSLSLGLRVHLTHFCSSHTDSVFIFIDVVGLRKSAWG